MSGSGSAPGRRSSGWRSRPVRHCAISTASRASTGEWSPPTERRSVTYANLPPGRYTFLARALSTDGTAGPTPAAIDVVDLVRRMRQHADEVFTTSGVKLTFRAPGDGDDMTLGPDVRRDVYLIFKEAANNAARHSLCAGRNRNPFQRFIVVVGHRR